MISKQKAEVKLENIYSTIKQDNIVQHLSI